MKILGRYFVAVLFFLLAITCYGYFEYWKLVESDSRYLLPGYGAGLLFFASVFLFLPVTTKNLKECLKVAVLVTMGVAVILFGFLKWKASTPLNQALHAKGRCESVLVEIFKHHFDGAPKNAQNICTLRLLKDGIHSSTIERGQAEIIEVGSLLQTENRLNDTSFVLLLSFYASLESEQNDKDKAASDNALDNVKAQFSLLEGVLPLFEVYQVRAVYEEDTSDVQLARMHKLVELSTLGKTLSVFLAKEHAGEAMVDTLLKQSEAGVKMPAGELTLLQVRVLKIKERFAKVQKRWNLAGILESLNFKDTYPEQYQKVHQEVTFESP